MLSSSTHNDLGDHSVSSVKDVVPLVLQQLGGLLSSAIDDDVGAVIEVAGKEVSHNVGGVGGDLRGLDDGRASGGDGADQGSDGQEEGVVPWGDDERGAYCS